MRRLKIGWQVGKFFDNRKKQSSKNEDLSPIYTCVIYCVFVGKKTQATVSKALKVLCLPRQEHKKCVCCRLVLGAKDGCHH
jgi:hypothetical protein